MRRKITNETWEQIKTGYAAGVGLREIARKMGIPEGTVQAHAKRHSWTQQIQLAKSGSTFLQPNATTPLQPLQPVQSVPQSIAEIFADRKERTRMGLSKFTAEAAEQAAEHKDKLLIAQKVRDVASIGATLWPAEQNRSNILNVAILTGARVPERSKPADVIITSPGIPERVTDESRAAKTEVTLGSRDMDPAPGPTPAQIAAQEKRQKEAEYRERCRHWRHYT
jgi:hypothetical protein